jgi:heme/copper-type cytochrome/quinol oxidase subunit 4
MARTMGQRASSEARAQNRGVRIIAILAVLTLVEYGIALTVASPAGLVVLLGAIALVKAWLIVTYFMHLPLAWRTDGGH